MNGILLVDKPAGYTSRDIVNIISKELKTKKVGHTGTLDPIASGVLVVCIGRYTKLVDKITSLDKEYIAQIKLGIKTDTLDITGNILEKNPFSVTKEAIEKSLKNKIGKYKMEVPIYSAIKVKGKKLYEYARNNIEVELPVKEVNIEDLELLDFHDDIIEFRAKVEKGTYIRSLIRDICKDLNTIGTMKSLIRTKQGKFELKDTNTLEEIKKKHFKMLTLQEALEVKSYELQEEEYLKVRNGNKISLPFNDVYLLLTYQKEEIALYQKENNDYKPDVMLKIS